MFGFILRDVGKGAIVDGDSKELMGVVGCYWPPQMVVLDGQMLEPKKVISTRSSTYDTNEYHPEPRMATIVASHSDSEWVVAIKETGMVWLVDYSDLDNLRMTPRGSSASPATAPAWTTARRRS